MHDFWVGGHAAYHDGLKSEFEERLHALEQQLKIAASDSEADQLKSQIRELRAQFERRQADARYNIY